MYITHIDRYTDMHVASILINKHVNLKGNKSSIGRD